MSILNVLIGIELKLKQYKVQFIFLILFWLAGLSIFVVIEPNHSLLEYILFSLTVRRPEPAGDFTNFYSLLWPILLEVIVFGFIMGELLEKYNPIITSRILAKHKRNHTVIIGFHHLTERIIEHCIANKEPFCVIEDQEVPNGFEYYSYRWSWYAPNLNTLVEDASHIRLKELYLGYDLPTKLATKVGFDNLRVFTHARNLGPIWTANDKGIDPEYVKGSRFNPGASYTFGFSLGF